VRAIVFTSTSERAFCAGADLKERRSMSDDDWLAQHQIMREAILRILRCPVPVIAAVEGHALGGGCELACASDFIVAGDRAIFALPEVARGILPGAGATQYLPRVVGAPVAKELIFTGRQFGAEEARSLGLVNHVVPAGEARSRALEIARTIAQNAPFAVRQAKKAINWGAETDLWTGLTLSFEAWDNTLHTEDRLEGVRAFNEKRKPRFQGR
jgi:enoyl-CoA hydratase/carnithine racemase